MHTSAIVPQEWFSSVDDEDLDTGRKTPPEDHEWPSIWRALDRSNKSWKVVGPIYAVVSNWKSLAFLATCVLAWNGPHIIELLEAFIGQRP